MAPPREWVELLHLHDLELARVRMLWRRGAGKYRILAARPDADTEEWDDHELVETHFHWRASADESSQQRHDRIVGAVETLWAVALEWTANHGPMCDYKLCGWDRNNSPLFEDGRRCTLAGDDEDAIEVDEVPRAATDAPPPSARDALGHVRMSWQHLDNLKDQFIERLTQDRNWSFDTAQRAMDVAPDTLTRTSEILKETIAFQREEVAHLRGRSVGETELRARAFAEMERTRRSNVTMEFLRYAVDASIGAAVPLANRLFEVLGNRSMQVFPEFKTAQQAIAYLEMTLTRTQLEQLFTDKPRAAGAFMAILHDASKLEMERDALEHLVDLLRIFRDSRFRDVASAEQQLAGNYIIGRMALYRMNEYDRAEATE